jgi:AcrR family transcriptional regulator
MPQKKRPCKVTSLICEALCQLIEEKRPYDSISLQEIVDKAGVCRNSFYRNYHSKEEIFQKKFREVSAETDALLLANPEKTRRGIINAIAKTMEANRDFLLCFYQANPKSYFDTLITQVESSNTTQPISSVSSKDYYIFSARAWLTIGVLTEWLQRGEEVPAYDIAGIIDSLKV